MIDIRYNADTSHDVTLDQLTGKHTLTGVEIGYAECLVWLGGHSEKCSAIKFVLDGKTYIAVEDPDDGYRSMLARLMQTDETCKTVIPPTEVVGSLSENTDRDVITFRDCITGKPVLSIGTDYTECYYPYCVMEWTPENLWCNQEGERE